MNQNLGGVSIEIVSKSSNLSRKEKEQELNQFV
jgi:hypothetical protein